MVLKLRQKRKPNLQILWVKFLPIFQNRQEDSLRNVFMAFRHQEIIYSACNRRRHKTDLHRKKGSAAISTTTSSACFWWLTCNCMRPPHCLKWEFTSEQFSRFWCNEAEGWWEYGLDWFSRLRSGRNPILPFTETPPVQRAACALPFEGSLQESTEIIQLIKYPTTSMLFFIFPLPQYILAPKFPMISEYYCTT